MHVEKLPSGRYRAVVQVDGQRRSVTRTTRAEAHAAGAELAIDLGANGSEWKVAHTVAEVVYPHLAAVADRWSPTTHVDMERIARRLPDRFMARPVNEVTPAVLDGLYRQLKRDGWSPHRVKRAHTLLSICFKRAAVYGWIRANPCRDVSPPPAPRTEVHAPEDDQVRAILAAADGQLLLFLKLAACTGARRGEVVALRWDDIDLEHAEVSVTHSLVQTVGDPVERGTKTGRKGHRKLALDSGVIGLLGDHRAAQAKKAADGGFQPVWLFSDDYGFTPWRPDRVSRSFRRAAARAGVTGVRLHDLRHHVATSMLEDGEEFIDVAAQLGHASVATTLGTYASYRKARGRDSADRRAARLR